MGGYGSGRWNYHNKASTADESKRLTLKAYRGALRSIERGERGMAMFNPSWSIGDKPAGSVTLIFTGGPGSVEARLEYTQTERGDKKTDYSYRVGLTTTRTPWDSLRYWWTCPNCGGRCGTLYLPPGAHRFACRKCHDLTYTSSQESHKYEHFMGGMLIGTGLDMPPAVFEAMLQWEKDPTKKPTARLRHYLEKNRARTEAILQAERERRQAEILAMLQAEDARWEAELAAKYARYLTPAELCDRAGLTAAELESLAAARLLVSDHEGKYRPKLEGWAVKLAYLLHAGWDIEAIRRWSCGRWIRSNSRSFPPDPIEWGVKSHEKKSH